MTASGLSIISRVVAALGGLAGFLRVCSVFCFSLAAGLSSEALIGRTDQGARPCSQSARFWRIRRAALAKSRLLPAGLRCFHAASADTSAQSSPIEAMLFKRAWTTAIAPAGVTAMACVSAGCLRDGLSFPEHPWPGMESCDPSMGRGATARQLRSSPHFAKRCASSRLRIPMERFWTTFVDDGQWYGLWMRGHDSERAGSAFRVWSSVRSSVDLLRSAADSGSLWNPRPGHPGRLFPQPGGWRRSPPAVGAVNPTHRG